MGSENHQEASTSSPEPPPSPPPSPAPSNYPSAQSISQQTEQTSVQYSTQQQPTEQTNDGTTDSGYQTQLGNVGNVNLSLQNAVVNASTLTRPSIPSFETPQTAAAESTTHTDSDADCENSK